jgi:hypothetical protein
LFANSLNKRARDKALIRSKQIGFFTLTTGKQVNPMLTVRSVKIGFGKFYFSFQKKRPAAMKSEGKVFLKGR